MPVPDQAFLLCRALRKKAGSEADKILLDAREKARRIITEAGEDTERRLGEWMGREQMSAHKQARQIKDAAELKARLAVMSAKKKLIGEIHESARERLFGLSEGPGYPGILKHLVLRAVKALPGNEVLLQVRSRDKALLSDNLLGEMARQTGKGVKVMDEPADITGGCIAYGLNKKVLVDYSFEVLLKRGTPLLKRLLARKVFEAGPREGEASD